LYEQKLAEIEGITVKDSLLVTDEEQVAHERLSDTELAKQSVLESIREAENREAISEPALETIEEKPLAEKPIEEINAEDFGPITEEPQFLPEAIAPVEFVPIEFEAVTPAEPEIEEMETADETVADEEVAIEATPEIEPKTIGEDTAVVVDESTSETVAAELAQESIEAEAVESIEEKLEIGKPLEFSKDETHSFAEWLQLTKIQPIVRDENPVAETPDESQIAIDTDDNQSTEKISKDALIDRFIENNPKMPKVKTETAPATTVQLQGKVESTEVKDDHSALMTETLARVYLEQRKYQKAIQAYEILILKYPEKSIFFADRIAEIKNLQQNI